MPPAVKCTQVQLLAGDTGCWGWRLFSRGSLLSHRLYQRDLALNCHRLMESVSSSEAQELCCQLVLVWQVTEEQGQSRDLNGHTETQVSSKTVLREPKVRAEAPLQPETQHLERRQGCPWGQQGWTQWEKGHGQGRRSRELGCPCWWGTWLR